MLEYLKEHTEKIHKEVESYSLAIHVLDHSISNDTFEEFLKRNYLAYRFIEDNLMLARHVLSEEVSSFVTSKKSDQLLKDLGGLTPASPEIIKNQLNISTEADAIGALYVIEGSLLGSCLINKHIMHCKSLQTRGKQYFFNDNTPATVENWKSFKKTINQYSFTEKDKYRSLIAARKTFLIFKNYYTVEF